MRNALSLRCFLGSLRFRARSYLNGSAEARNANLQKLNLKK